MQTFEKSSSESSKSTSEASKRGRKAGAIYFPRHPLNEVLPIAEVIWTQNAGNPFDILDVAKAVGQSPTSGRFILRLASAYRYGLTEGSPSTKMITLTPLGSAIVAPTADTNLNAELRKALLHSPIFQQVYGWLDRKPIPKEDVLRNTLMKPSDLGGFGIPKEDVDEFVRVFMQNIEDYGLADVTAQGVNYLRLDKLSPAVVVVSEETLPPVEFQLDLKRPGELLGVAGRTNTPTPEFQPQVPKQIFVAHGKNKRPLEQLEKILNKFGVPYKVAEEEPHRGRPIGDKVAQLMRLCTSGIFIFTADEETQDTQGNKIFRPSDNVVYELGAASVLYGKKIVILKEKDVTFASDFSDIGHLPFEKDKLDSTAADIMVELIGLGFLEVRPT